MLQTRLVSVPINKRSLKLTHRLIRATDRPTLFHGRRIKTLHYNHANLAIQMAV